MEPDDAERMRERAQRQLDAAEYELAELDGKVTPAREDASGKRYCSARSSRTGKPCRMYPVPGTNVCKMHGGSAPQVKAKAKQRIEYAADRMAKELLKMASDDHMPAAVKLNAIRDALDRAGLNAKHSVDVGVSLTPFEQIIYDGVATVSREDSRAARGLEDDEALSLDEIKRYQRIENHSGSDDLVSNSGSNFDPTAPVDSARCSDDDGSQHAAPRPQANGQPRYPYGAGDCVGSDLEPIDAEIVYPDNPVTGDEAMAVAAVYVRAQRVIEGPRPRRALPRGRS